MKKCKCIPIAIVFLMLMIPITAVGQTIQTSIEEKNQSEENNSSIAESTEPIEENTELNETGSLNSDISVRGGLWFSVIINNRKITQRGNIEEGYKYEVSVRFDGGQKIIPQGGTGFLRGWGKTRVYFGFIFGYRFDGYISGRQGNAVVTVRILKPVGGGWYLPVLTETYSGTIRGPFISFN